jgi:putative ABC transport system permease protein
VLGVAPQLGRAFEPDEDAPGGGPGGYTVVLSYEFWKRHFKGDPQALGSVLTLDGRTHTVVGVMPRGFQFPIETEPFDVYTTFAPEAESIDGGKPATEQRGSHSLQSVGRLKPGVSVEQASAELRTIAAALAQQYPDSNTNWSMVVVPLRENMVGDVSGGLYVLCGAVGCVLLIASANMANLLLARATVRGKEIALRCRARREPRSHHSATTDRECVARGDRWIVRARVCRLGHRHPGQAHPAEHPAYLGDPARWRRAGLHAARLARDRRALWPRARLPGFKARSPLLPERGGRGSAGGARHRLRNALVIAEVALALLLLTGAGLLLKSFAA